MYVCVYTYVYIKSLEKKKNMHKDLIYLSTYIKYFYLSTLYI